MPVLKMEHMTLVFIFLSPLYSSSLSSYFLISSYFQPLLRLLGLIFYWHGKCNSNPGED